MNPDQEREKNQQEFREILTRYGITQAKAAELIMKETGQKVALGKSDHGWPVLMPYQPEAAQTGRLRL